MAAAPPGPDRGASDMRPGASRARPGASGTGPGASGTRSGTRPGREVAAALTVGGVVAVVSWFRMSPTARATLWAEDGTYFLGDAIASPTLTSPLLPYDGYLHLVPRLAGELVVAVVPPLWYAQAMAALSCLVAGGVAALVHRLASSVVASGALRTGIALVTALVPALPIEVLGNMANVHWYVLWLTPWLLLHRPASRRAAWLLGAVALVGALTEAQVIYFAPLLVWRWRDAAYRPVRLGYVVGLVAQGVAVVLTPRPDRGGELVGVGDMTAAFLVNALMTVWVGSREAIADVIGRWGWGVVLVPAAVVVASFVVAVWRGSPTQRAAALALLGGGLLAWYVPVVVNRREDLAYSGPDDALALLPVIRYAVVPSMFLLALVLVGLAVVGEKGAVRAWLGLLVLAPVVVVAVTNVQPVGRRDDGPVWEQEVAAARATCATGAFDVVNLAVAPRGWGSVAVPCRMLEPGSRGSG